MNSFINNEDGLNEVLSIFYQQSKEDLAKIKKSVDESDHEVFGSTAHRMLTMCRQLGAKRVIPILETMEHSALDNPSHTEMESLYASLKMELNKLLEALKGRTAAIA